MRLPAASQTIPLAAAPPTVWVGHLIMLVVLLPFHGVGGVIVLSWCWWCYCLIMDGVVCAIVLSWCWWCYCLIMVLVVLVCLIMTMVVLLSYHGVGGASVLSWCWWCYCLIIVLVVLSSYHGVGDAITLSCWWCYCLIMLVVLLPSDWADCLECAMDNYFICMQTVGFHKFL